MINGAKYKYIFTKVIAIIYWLEFIQHELTNFTKKLNIVDVVTIILHHIKNKKTDGCIVISFGP